MTTTPFRPEQQERVQCANTLPGWSNVAAWRPGEAVKHHVDGCKGISTGPTAWTPRPGTAAELAQSRECERCQAALDARATTP